MDTLGWDACDVVLVTGDAYVDHPSFGMALVGRLLEAAGFRVGILAQPDWRSAEPFRALGHPRLYFGVTAGNMDSMVNRYTSDKRLRHDDAYTPGGQGGARPDRASIVYAQRCREAFRDAGPRVPIVLGGIEASLRRVAHWDYWSEKVRRSVLLDAKADILLYGNAERALIELTYRLAAGEPIAAITDLRGTVVVRKAVPEGWDVLDETTTDAPGAPPLGSAEAQRVAVRLPSFEAIRDDRVLYAHASRLLHREANPHNARALVQRHGDRELWVNPPPIPLTTPELDAVFDRPFARVPHPRYGDAKIPAYEMIRFSVIIQRGCFGGCTFCSITEHEGRVIQSRSQRSVLREIAQIRDHQPGFTGVISDLGGPTANMYRLACKDPHIQAGCRKPSCVYPTICPNLNTDHSALTALYRKARAVPGVKKILIASGVRYDLAVKDPKWVAELVQHHVGGYLKIAPEHLARGPLSKMMKPGMDSYYAFEELFQRFSREAGKRQYLIPYFIAAHPGTTDEDMLELALWLKTHGFKTDQVQTFLPSPMATATAMYHTAKNPLRRVTPTSEEVVVPRGLKVRRLHKAFLRWHAPESWPLLRQALRRMGRADLIGDAPDCLVPATDYPPRGRPPRGRNRAQDAAGSQSSRFQTQHTGLANAASPRTAGEGRPGRREGPRTKPSRGRGSKGRGPNRGRGPKRRR